MTNVVQKHPSTASEMRLHGMAPTITVIHYPIMLLLNATKPATFYVLITVSL